VIESEDGPTFEQYKLLSGPTLSSTFRRPKAYCGARYKKAFLPSATFAQNFGNA